MQSVFLNHEPAESLNSSGGSSLIVVSAHAQYNIWPK